MTLFCFVKVSQQLQFSTNERLLFRGKGLLILTVSGEVFWKVDFETTQVRFVKVQRRLRLQPGYN